MSWYKEVHGEKVHTRTYTGFCRKSFARTRSPGPAAAAAEPKTRVRLNTPLQNRNIMLKINDREEMQGEGTRVMLPAALLFRPRHNQGIRKHYLRSHTQIPRRLAFLRFTRLHSVGSPPTHLSTLSCSSEAEGRHRAFPPITGHTRFSYRNPIHQVDTVPLPPDPKPRQNSERCCSWFDEYN